MDGDRPPAGSDEAGAAPIEERVVIGDTRTAALIHRGTIEWLCLPRFDSDPVFSSLVAGGDGGRFAIRPADPRAEATTRYRVGSAVAETTWTSPAGRLLVTDGMVADLRGDVLPTLLLVRRVEALTGPIEVVIEVTPRRGRDRRPPKVGRRGDAAIATWGDVALAITTEPVVDLPVGTALRRVVEPGHPLTIAMGAVDREPLAMVPADEAWRRLEETDRWWRGWAQDLDVPQSGLGPAAVERSMITLRLLTYAPSGAPVASPTTSLPEQLGGSMNWDYRYTWPRDASIGVSAALEVSKGDEADAFLYWLLHAGRLNRPRLPPALRIDGRPTPVEREHEWPGYADSRPVRFGNAAARQHQLDVYGWVVDAAWNYHRTTDGIDRETWRLVRQLATYVCDHWDEPDAGIWERRGDPQHYVFSKLMAWLALDRAIALSEDLPARDRHVRRWCRERDRLAHDIRDNGFDHRRGTYVAHYGGDALDASLLLLPVLGFDPARSEAVTGTVDTIRHGLSAGDPLLYRFSDMVGREGAFLPCSFWLAQALALTGRADEAADVFDRLWELAPRTGLLAEEIDPATGHHLGNMPMVFSHATLIQAALAIDEAMANGSSSAGGQQDAE
jgi:GH15 family glucan-1,4-alpha-glucosidase